MQKTRKGVAKRFKVTSTGKLKRRKQGLKHLLRNKTTKQKRAGRHDQSVSPGFEPRLKRALPFA